MAMQIVIPFSVITVMWMLVFLFFFRRWVEDEMEKLRVCIEKFTFENSFFLLFKEKKCNWGFSKVRCKVSFQSFLPMLYSVSN